MKAIYNTEQRDHYPSHAQSGGILQPNPERPERIDALAAGAKTAGFENESPNDYGIEPIAAIHTSEYIQFLKNIYSRWKTIPGAATEVIPNVHPDHRGVCYPKSIVGQVGYHTYDTACPISANTYLSSYWSAQTAVHGAHQLLRGDTAAYALCRPPGHHATRDMAGGFCYFNNSAIAAQTLLDQGRRPAIVDVDLHHGNGTQIIFYHRDDVLTVSIHADPAEFYPYYWGYAEEQGTGPGTGYNLNLPIPVGTGDRGFLAALETGIGRLVQFGPDVLVVALGLDAFKGDPFAGLAITTKGFALIASVLAELKLPTLIVQEGGYLCPELGDNLAGFIGEFN
jgi:acetoin utilization deacetylase AcuC-like enzyme